MDRLHHYLPALALAEPRRYRNITLTPICAVRPTAPDYLTLGAALASRRARIQTHGTRAQAPGARLHNTGDRPLLLLEGEALSGATGDHVLEHSLLVAPRESMTLALIPLEQRANQPTPTQLTPAGQLLFASARARSAARITARLFGEPATPPHPRALCEDIALKLTRMDCHDSHPPLGALYDDYAEFIGQYISALPPQPDQIGAIIAINERICGLELFAHPATLRELLPRIIASYALDAIECLSFKRRRAPLDAPGTLLDALTGAPVMSQPLHPGSELLRLTVPGLSGGGLLVDGRLLHLHVYRNPFPAQPEPPPNIAPQLNG
ncbi:ARPP-1 family domain-containing protein [Marichromatium bheemlicum]|uniref:ARG and Rhodanese-Phosphatase-superfamily-associated domain-containing protein n=1 Tax=Marichromatium bheemlicum TaxID=365339 RepID=A0ABX1I3Y2_9GAMM|nr:DUF6569 family protein [Marichromatium bheemlicum]NKN31793.1 hypothetical protein [Marichromatium bheemlicum]